MFKKIGLFFVLTIAFTSIVLGQNNHSNGNGNVNGNGRSAVLKVNEAKFPWSITHLAEKLMVEVTRNGNGDIISADALVASMPPFPSDLYSTDSLAAWGTETGRRYLVIVNIDTEGLEKHKTFNIPLVVSKYEHVGVVTGELRIIDVIRKKVVLADQFIFEKEAKRIVQAAIDDDINDADLHISAPEKIRFFGELENELAKELANKIRSATGLR